MNQTPGLGRKILVIDDEFALTEVMRDALEFDGYEVSTARNGQEGLDKLLHQSPPSLILLDMIMPIMGGEAFLQQVAKTSWMAQIPVVVVSATANPNKVPGARVVIRKPPDLDALLVVVAKLSSGTTLH